MASIERKTAHLAIQILLYQIAREILARNYFLQHYLACKMLAGNYCYNTILLSQISGQYYREIIFIPQ